jgi:hypothetical protein
MSLHGAYTSSGAHTLLSIGNRKYRTEADHSRKLESKLKRGAIPQLLHAPPSRGVSVLSAKTPTATYTAPFEPQLP